MRTSSRRLQQAGAPKQKRRVPGPHADAQEAGYSGHSRTSGCWSKARCWRAQPRRAGGITSWTAARQVGSLPGAVPSPRGGRRRTRRRSLGRTPFGKGRSPPERGPSLRGRRLAGPSCPLGGNSRTATLRCKASQRLQARCRSSSRGPGTRRRNMPGSLHSSPELPSRHRRTFEYSRSVPLKREWIQDGRLWTWIFELHQSARHQWHRRSWTTL